MDAHLIDSQIFGHLWSTEESHRIFDEQPRLERWVSVIAALGRAQASLGIIPEESAAAISALDVKDLSIAAIARGTAETSHSTLGLIHELQAQLPDFAVEHVYFGTTVQDITDTSLALEMKAVGSLVYRDLDHIESVLLTMAETFRDSPMCGRTHGQPGSPISFGFKVATWVDEIGRHMERLGDVQRRCLVAQLGGAVGTLGFFGADALELRKRFSNEVGLAEPSISWLTSRDRLAEFASVIAMVCASLARIANEVYVLQRREVDELREASSGSTVGSITMPHKRNPESSEQIISLARVVRAQAALLTEGMVQEHERDARGWKVEWAAFPEMCHYATAATALSRVLVDNLEVRPKTMLANVYAATYFSSEQILRHLSAQLGKHRAQEVLNEAYREAQDQQKPILDVLPADLVATIGDSIGEIDIGSAAEMVDVVVERSRKRRATDSSRWP